MNDGIIVFFVISWIVWTVINAMVAGAKNRSIGLAILVSILCSPLTSYLYLLAVPALPKSQQAEKTK